MQHRRRFSVKDTKEGRYFLIYTTNMSDKIFITFATLKIEGDELVAVDALPEYHELSVDITKVFAVIKNPAVTYGFEIKSGYDMGHTIYELTEAEIFHHILMETI